MSICCVVGARPNFMKMAPVILELRARGAAPFVVHTGQHYDTGMSKVFFQELGLPEPDVFLGVGSDTHSRQTARIMVEFEAICRERKPRLVIVAGDVNSTLAAALVAAKERIPLAHVEAGLRSFDREMPEETNRILTDHVSDFLFTTEASANENLRREGLPPERIHFVGNCMVDSVLKHIATALGRRPWTEHGLEPGAYAVLTLHRPSNVDDEGQVRPMLAAIAGACGDMPLLFPVHPRTRPRLGAPGELPPNLRLCEPLPYLAFLGLIARARVVLTDSGGIQEETTALGVPCLTLRKNTERPVTVREGTNRLVDPDPAVLRSAVAAARPGAAPPGRRPELWDGRAAVRIADVLLRCAERER